MSQILLTDVRSKFLDYFKKNNHKLVESSNLVPNNDPNLKMFLQVLKKNLLKQQQRHRNA